ncbi:hypothetical protein [Pontibacillus marinus]|uniref:Uncharacterized protein n=1 Tax=Pontibacillus marinus BH030004 = DSM 16465 TaxID=1385511 RepID=A0A0A5FX08_9BACI|nr:hypothetical protein [Pontibacillus marinus]KGX84449.1 hypothetical protein N783_17400 [Pontibacillus marinus BH030004 = DSM 16465]
MTSYNEGNVQSEDPVTQEKRSKKHYKKPWYNQGWLWLIIAIISLGIFFFLFQGLIDQLSQLTQATQEQNQILSGIKEKMNELMVELNRVASDVVQVIQSKTKA